MKAATIAALILSFGGVARAADAALQCWGVVYGDDLSTLALGRVTGAGRANFAANAADHKGCPSDAPECRRPAFLLPGDAVVYDHDATLDGFTCVTFIDKKGAESSGWLRASRITPASATLDWAGRWRRGANAEINIAPKPGGKAEIHGAATWGVGAATHDGEISAIIDPGQPLQSFANSGDEQIPFEKAGEYDCAVRLKQLGP